jgi:hypothetical protein
VCGIQKMLLMLLPFTRAASAIKWHRRDRKSIHGVKNRNHIRSLAGCCALKQDMPQVIGRSIPTISAKVTGLSPELEGARVLAVQAFASICHSGFLGFSKRI